MCPYFKKLNQGSATAASKSTVSRQPKPPHPSVEEKLELPDPLGDTEIINLSRQTCFKLACKKNKEINEFTGASDKRPLIEVNSTLALG